MPPVPDRPPLRVALAVGIVAGSTLALQVLLTRIFSSVLFYHFAFLAISLALLGTGAGALLIYVRPRWFERPHVEALLARWSAVFAALLVVAPTLLVRIDYGDVTRGVTWDFALALAAAAVISALPFLAAGIMIALAIRQYVRSVGRIYAFDLAGAGLGALGVVPLLWLLDAPTLVVGLGAAVAVAAVLCGWRAPRERALGVGLAAVAVGGLVVSATTSLNYVDPPAEDFFNQRAIVERWTPISRVVGYHSTAPWMTYDQDVAFVPQRRADGSYPDWRRLGTGPQSVGYRLTGPGRVLIIGGGGGRDIYSALTSGQRRVDVIELNRGIRRVVDEDLARWSGSPYSLPRVHTEIGDGRSRVASRDTKYDQIHIGFTTTLAASSGHAYALSESNLYTVEAFDDYFDHLRPGGVLNVTRPYRLTGEEALRATVLALEALRRRGVRDPSRHVVVVLGHAPEGPFGTVLARAEPYTDAELAMVRRLALERDHSGVGQEPGGVAFPPGRREDLGVAFAPGGPYLREWKRLARVRDLDSFCADYHENICPPTDDKPFFFNSTRLGDLGEELSQGSPAHLSRTPYTVLLTTLGILLVLSSLAFLLPLALVSRTRRPPTSSLVFFVAIGLGFLLLEVVLIQRFVLFLGFPTYALSVVLFSLLVFSGIGAWLSGRFAEPRRALLVALAGASLLIAVSAVALAPVLRELIQLPFAARIAVTVSLLGPLALMLGMAMPIGLGRLAGLHPDGVPWAWGVNGIMSVLASVLAVAVALGWGFTATTVLAFLCYLVALGHALFGGWPEDGGGAQKPAPGVPREEPEPAPA
jgi:hypothetical protein